MSESLIAKIKRTVLEGASTTASKLEEGARIGKLKIDIVAEENRIEGRFARLGELYYQAVEAGNTEELKLDPAQVELLGSIAEHQKRILELKAQLKAIQGSSSAQSE